MQQFAALDFKILPLICDRCYFAHLYNNIVKSFEGTIL